MSRTEVETLEQAKAVLEAAGALEQALHARVAELSARAARAEARAEESERRLLAQLATRPTATSAKASTGMVGLSVTRDSVLRVLRMLEAEVIEGAHAAARGWASGQRPPMAKGAYALWVDGKEEHLAVIEALRCMVLQLPPSATLAEAEAPVRAV